ncbi:MAG: MFS transporter [Clostridiales bacterium]|nr:MFS transporter [Clostridiales bacterium]
MDNKNTQKMLLLINGLKIILTIFTSTFFTSYIVALNKSNIFGAGIINVGSFYLSQYLIYILTYLLLSRFVAKSNRVNFLRLAIIINGLLLISLVFFGNYLLNWIFLAGALIGVSDAFYNSSYLVMKNEVVKKKNINNFNIKVSVLTNLINIIIPIILGYLIDLTTFNYIAIYVIVIVVFQLIFSFFISPYRPKLPKFKLKEFCLYLKNNAEDRSKLKWNYLNLFFAGFKNTYKVLIVILTIYVFETNFSLGILTSIFSIITTILLIIFKKFEYHKKMNKLLVFMIVSILPIILCVLFIILQNSLILIALNFSLTLAIQLSEYASNSSRDAIIKCLNKYEYIVEHQFLSEAFMCLSRILSYTIFIIVGLFQNITLFTILLIILISLNPIKFYFMYKLETVRENLSKELNNI